MAPAIPSLVRQSLCTPNRCAFMVTLDRLSGAQAVVDMYEWAAPRIDISGLQNGCLGPMGIKNKK